jgi:hypothetical protein
MTMCTLHKIADKSVQNSASSKGARYYFKRAAGQEMLVLN